MEAAPRILIITVFFDGFRVLLVFAILNYSCDMIVFYTGKQGTNYNCPHEKETRGKEQIRLFRCLIALF